MSIESKVVNAINIIESDVSNLQFHPLKNKWITIIGDSLSSFDGWCIVNGELLATNAHPSSYNDITEVSDMWWYKLIIEVGAKLCTCAALNGSKLCNINSDTNSACYRVLTNGDWYRHSGNTYMNIDGTTEIATENQYPDYIFILIGSNDIYANKDDSGWPTTIPTGIEPFTVADTATNPGTHKIFPQLWPLVTTSDAWGTNGGNMAGALISIVNEIRQTAVTNNDQDVKIYFLTPVLYRGNHINSELSYSGSHPQDAGLGINVSQNALIYLFQHLESIYDVYYIPSQLSNYSTVNYATLNEESPFYHYNKNGMTKIANKCIAYSKIFN